MKVKKDAEAVCTSEFYYDLIDGGYIIPTDLLENKEDVDKVNRAIATLEGFKNTLENNNLIEEM